MERVCVFFQLLLVSLTSVSLASCYSPVKVPQSDRVAGVFLLIDGGKYTLNFTAARAACRIINATIATRAQMERAVQHGLETCKFGWTAEQISVIPRLRPDKNCGGKKTGVVTWVASPDKKFGVFCFSASDVEETSKKSAPHLQSSTFSSQVAPPSQTSGPAKPLLTSTAQSMHSRKPAAAAATTTTTTTAPKQTSFTSAITLLFKEAHSTIGPSTSTTLKAFSTSVPTSVPQHITPKPAVTTFASSASVQSHVSVSYGSAIRPPVSPVTPALGDVPTALIILGIILLLLAAAGVVWYYKLNIFRFWSQGQQKDDIETEMWKCDDSEMDLHSLHDGEEEEEESYRRYSRDIMLCVHPNVRGSSSE